MVLDLGLFSDTGLNMVAVETGDPANLKSFARSGDMIWPVLAAWPDETNRLPLQRPWSA
jgi:hypothetical protein